MYPGAIPSDAHACGHRCVPGPRRFNPKGALGVVAAVALYAFAYYVTPMTVERALSVSERIPLAGLMWIVFGCAIVLVWCLGNLLLEIVFPRSES